MLIGSDRLPHDPFGIRPLGFSTLADLVHHIRGNLTLQQLRKVVHIFSRIIHDCTLPLPIQSTSVRLLLNLVDHIYHNQDPNAAMGRTLLNYILETLVEKFGTLRKYALPPSEGETSSPQKSSPAKTHTQTDNLSSGAGIGRGTSASSSTTIGTPNTPNINSTDVKALLKTMLLGLKTVIWCVHNYRTGSTPTNPNTNAKPSGPIHQFTTAEKALLSKYVNWAMSCLKIYRSPETLEESPQYKEILENFSASLTVLPPPTLRSILHGLMPDIFQMLLEDPAVMQVIQGLLMNELS